jgi:N-acetylmuramoyl-L-alanine amidase/Zinc carboxypeptidase
MGRVLALAATAAALAAPPALPERIVPGHSVQGRAIVAMRRGAADAPVRVLVTGSIHGSELAGHAVIARLRRMRPPAGVQLWLVRSVNPDGALRGTRQNARGVDLNRNFPRRWRGGGRPFDTYFPGPRPASEPETRALMRLVRRVRPHLSMHYHQALRLVNLSVGADPAVVRAYARRVGLPAAPLPHYRGTATSWSNHELPGTSAFVVELPGGPLSRAGARRHARAVLAVAGSRASAAVAPRPSIRWHPIPYGPRRRAQMRAYARRHYGLDTARLREPKVIVEHYTASSTLAPAWNTFAANQPDVELHERPGVCTHFIVDRDGTIHQLVPLGLMCRHVIGLNHVSIGIEHVGLSDAQVMGRPAQLRASLALTRWLKERFGIRRRDVIGHAESLSSPYHHERVAGLRRRTHGDFAPATMRRYRRLLDRA